MELTPEGPCRKADHVIPAQVTSGQTKQWGLGEEEALPVSSPGWAPGAESLAPGNPTCSEEFTPIFVSHLFLDQLLHINSRC